MRAMAMTVFAVFSLLFSVSTATAEPAKVKTGYEITGCTDYKLDPDTGRVIQVCKEDAKTLFFVRGANGIADNGVSSDAGDSGSGDSGGEGGESE